LVEAVGKASFTVAVLFFIPELLLTWSCALYII
jgi:hypothetical protein